MLEFDIVDDGCSGCFEKGSKTVEKWSEKCSTYREEGVLCCASQTQLFFAQCFFSTSATARERQP